jgi:peptidoglycan/LPS O-acetylase OafA/YrhL
MQFPEDGTPGRVTRRIPSLDGMRAVAIALVLISHGLGNSVNWEGSRFSSLMNSGLLGVQIFFVLSGYLITRLLLEEHEKTSTISLREFYIRRAFRILPAASIFLLFIALFFGRQIGWWHVAAAALYVANLDRHLPLVIGHLWTLSVEEQFYLLWPFVLKRWYRYRTAVLIAVFLFPPVLRLLHRLLHGPDALVQSLPAMGDQLAIGCLLAVFEARLPKIGRRAAWSMLLVILVYAFYPTWGPEHRLMAHVLRPLADVSIAGIVLHVIQVPYRTLNSAPVVWLGRISYSLYLWQQVFTTPSILRRGSFVILLAPVCAALSYYLIEQPMLRLRERRRRRLEIESPPQSAGIRSLQEA